jgi:hypothetical protein
MRNVHNKKYRYDLFMKIYVHLDEDSTPLPPHTLKIDDASSLTVANVVEQFCAAYVAKVTHHCCRFFVAMFTPFTARSRTPAPRNIPALEDRCHASFCASHITVTHFAVPPR